VRFIVIFSSTRELIFGYFRVILRRLFIQRGTKVIEDNMADLMGLFLGLFSCVLIVLFRKLSLRVL
jgi:hypothetical protein